MELNTEKLNGIRSGEAFDTRDRTYFGEIDLMDVEELLRLRAEIDSRLPATRLSDMNLEEELVRQYLQIQALQTVVMEDKTTPANQKAQVAATVANTLQHLVKMQTEYHTAERFKAIENLMIKYFKTLPLDVVEKFMDEYEAMGAK